MNVIARLAKLFGSVRVWCVCGVLFCCLSRLDDSATTTQSPFWFLDPILLFLFALAIWFDFRRLWIPHFHWTRYSAVAAYLLGGWGLGMIYELSLTVDGTGIGGIHQDTIASFLLAQGDYWAIVTVGWLAIRSWRLTLESAFFLAGGIALSEGLIFNGALLAVIASPMFLLAPVVQGYYTCVYALITVAPLLVIDEQLLWRNGLRVSIEPPPRPRRMVLVGLAIGIAIRIFWGGVYCPIVEKLFRLPTNVAAPDQYDPEGAGPRTVDRVREGSEQPVDHWQEWSGKTVMA